MSLCSCRSVTVTGDTFIEIATEFSRDVRKSPLLAAEDCVFGSVLRLRVWQAPDLVLLDARYKQQEHLDGIERASSHNSASRAFAFASGGIAYPTTARVPVRACLCEPGSCSCSWRVACGTLGCVLLRSCLFAAACFTLAVSLSNGGLINVCWCFCVGCG